MAVDERKENRAKKVRYTFDIQFPFYRRRKHTRTRANASYIRHVISFERQRAETFDDEKLLVRLSPSG